MIIAVGWSNANGLREEKHRAGKARGYSFITYVSSRAVVWPDLVLSENCMIFEGVLVQPFVQISEGTILRSGCHISHHVKIGKYCFAAPQTLVGGRAEVGERCFLGMGSIVLPRVRLADRCFVASGSRVVRDTEPDGIYDGNPARRRSASVNRLRKI
jgi:sugar O-acyltransferase (sialic acid O-acetyltransferase NeuD family)